VQAYVSYVGEKASLEAARTSERDAATNLEAAEKRRAAGLATIADVLQARTARSQATLDAQTIAGGVATLRGALATAIGLPANVSFDVLPLPAEVPAGQVAAAAEELIARAIARRPDLAEARELWQAAEANLHKVRGEGLPRLSLSGTAGRTWYDPSEFASSADTWSVALALRVPLFTGFKNRYDLVKARARADQAAEAARGTERDIVFDVWASFNDLETAAQRIVTSRDLLASAEESEKVAFGRYKEGVGTILDLLNAQSALARARALEVAARADWIFAAARLARSTGALDGPSAVALVPGPPSER
jgi:outer membrane protein TolC